LNKIESPPLVATEVVVGILCSMKDLIRAHRHRQPSNNDDWVCRLLFQPHPTKGRFAPRSTLRLRARRRRKVADGHGCTTGEHFEYYREISFIQGLKLCSVAVV